MIKNTMSLNSIFAVLGGLMILSMLACEPTVVRETDPGPNDFLVTIENVFEEKDFFATGTFDEVGPETSISFAVNARPGQHLSLITSLSDTTDLFFGFEDNGIDLFPGGTALTGDITEMLNIWDAGVLDNQMDTIIIVEEPIELVNNAFAEDILDRLTISLEHNGSSEFIVTIENLTLSMLIFNGISEGAWVVHESDQRPLYTEGGMATQALNSLAWFNTPADYVDYLELNSGLFSSLAPGAFELNDSLFFLSRMVDGSFESLAEDGDPSGYADTFTQPDGSSSPGPIAPSQSYSFVVRDASDGDYFSLASMIVETNDWFIGSNYIPLYHNNLPLSGEITSIMRVWDAGTEQDEFPGVGPNQSPRQSGDNVGTAEGELPMTEKDETFKVPDINSMVKVTLEVL